MSSDGEHTTTSSAPCTNHDCNDFYPCRLNLIMVSFAALIYVSNFEMSIGLAVDKQALSNIVGKSMYRQISICSSVCMREQMYIR